MKQQLGELLMYWGQKLLSADMNGSTQVDSLSTSERGYEAGLSNTPPKHWLDMVKENAPRLLSESDRQELDARFSPSQHICSKHDERTDVLVQPELLSEENIQKSDARGEFPEAEKKLGISKRIETVITKTLTHIKKVKEFSSALKSKRTKNSDSVAPLCDLNRVEGQLYQISESHQPVESSEIIDRSKPTKRCQATENSHGIRNVISKRAKKIVLNKSISKMKGVCYRVSQVSFVFGKKALAGIMKSHKKEMTRLSEFLETRKKEQKKSLMNSVSSHVLDVYEENNLTKDSIMKDSSAKGNEISHEFGFSSSAGKSDNFTQFSQSLFSKEKPEIPSEKRLTEENQLTKTSASGTKKPSIVRKMRSLSEFFTSSKISTPQRPSEHSNASRKTDTHRTRFQGFVDDIKKVPSIDKGAVDRFDLNKSLSGSALESKEATNGLDSDIRHDAGINRNKTAFAKREKNQRIELKTDGLLSQSNWPILPSENSNKPSDSHTENDQPNSSLRHQLGNHLQQESSRELFKARSRKERMGALWNA